MQGNLKQISEGLHLKWQFSLRLQEIPIMPLEEVTDDKMEGIVTMEFKYPKENLVCILAHEF